MMTKTAIIDRENIRISRGVLHLLARILNADSHYRGIVKGYGVASQLSEHSQIYLKLSKRRWMMKQPSGFTLVFFTVMLGYVLGYWLYVTINPKYPFEADMPNYSVALIQRDHPELFSRDPVFRDGVFTNMIWSSSYAYMTLYKGLYNLTGQNISATIALLQLIPGLILFLTFYWFLRAFPLNRWLCLMFSVGFSCWLIVGRQEGIPSTFYYACIPIFLRLLWQQLAEPSLHDRHVVLWRIVAIGMMIGVSPMLINSVNGLAFNLLTLILVTVQFLARRMRWQSYLALLGGLIPLLLFAAMGGAGGASAIHDRATADFLFKDVYRGTTEVILQLDFIIHGVWKIFNLHNSWIFYLPVLIAVVVMNIFVRYARRSTRTLRIIYLSVNTLMWWAVIGNVGIILYMYFLSRLWRQRERQLDYILITGISVGAFIGPSLLWICVILWKVLPWYPLVFIMWQLFRFHLLTFFIAGLALVFMIEDLTERIDRVSTRCLIQAMFILMLGIQSVETITISISSLVMLGIILIFIYLSLSSKRYFTGLLISNSRAVAKLALVAVGALVSVFALAFWTTWGGWYSSVPLDLQMFLKINQDIESSQHQMQIDYMDMTEWLRLNTPLESLIHLKYDFKDRNGYFRFLTQRAMFFTWMDQNVGQYSSKLAASNRQLAYDVSETSRVRFGSLVALYHINYVVVHSGVFPFLPTLDKGQWYVPVPAYSNKTYDIYQVKKLSIGEFIAMLFSRSDV
jgi:hypothetical protein